MEKGQYPGGASKVSACIQGIIWRTFFRRKWRKQFLCADVYQFPYLGMFVAADYTGEKIWKYTPSQIVSQIEYQPDIMGGKW